MMAAAGGMMGGGGLAPAGGMMGEAGGMMGEAGGMMGEAGGMMGQAPQAALDAAPGPRVPAADNATSNLAFALTAGEATFGPNNTLILADVSPAVTYFATVPRYHAGARGRSRGGSEIANPAQIPPVLCDSREGGQRTQAIR
jgi:hypothetical protein